MKNRTIIIAEAGVNHNGNLQMAKKLITAAKKSGADFIKFQSFHADLISIKTLRKTFYQKKNTYFKNENQNQMLKRLELHERKQKKLFEYAKKIKINFISSAFDIKSLNFLKKLNMKYFKIPSPEITNYPLLQAIGKFNKKIILSTGMSKINEIKSALKVLIKSGTKKSKISLLHCNSEYPTPFNDANLNAILTLKKKFKLKTGYSDHTMGIEASIAAVTLGAEIIEKHLTLDCNLPGPDHKTSIEPEEFKQLVQSIRNIEISLGSGKKVVSKSEKKNISIVRKSIVAKTRIKKGEKFSLKNLTTKRPGSGISPMKINVLLKKKSKKNFKKDQLISIK